MNDDRKWFVPSSMICREQAAYHPGSYLEVMLNTLRWIALCGLIDLLVMGVQITTRKEFAAWPPFVGFAPFVATASYVLIKSRIINARRKTIEDGLLSIHSCAVMWQAVVLAHFRALERLRVNPAAYGYEGYTGALAEEAVLVKQSLISIDDYVLNPPPIIAPPVDDVDQA